MRKLIINITFLCMAIPGLGQSPLNDYLNVAAKNNPGLKARYAEFEAAMEKVPQAKSLQEPTLSFGYFISPVETRVGPQRARFSLSQMFPWFGTLKERGDVAALQAEASYIKFIDAREKLFMQVKGQYYQLWEAYKLIGLEKENLEILRTYENLAQTRFSTSEGRLSSVFRVQLEQKQVNTKLEILKDRIIVLERSFFRLINSEPDTAGVIVADSIVLPAGDPVFARDSLTNHPNVKFFELQQAAAIESRRVAEKSGYPSIGAGIDYVIVGRRSDMSMPDNGKNVLMPMATISIPIWRKKYKAAVKEAEFKGEQFQLEQENMSNTLASQLDMAVYEMQSARSELELYKEQIDIAQRTLELTISDYTNDLEEFERILEVQQRLIQFERSFYKSYKEYLLKYAEIEYLTYEINEDTALHEN
ncbi:TolC family protein [Fulvivirga ulvae]|uniref:TolC family protein n=1 Tax=Fulvivirga ulvae TaxID=2904245 RepID=UPI001F306F9B|nr:TolC family protein [Fulvivirga ulvae]UII33074.1 TolC family protein [Fulvivirga ulvae]